MCQLYVSFLIVLTSWRKYIFKTKTCCAHLKSCFQHAQFQLHFVCIDMCGSVYLTLSYFFSRIRFINDYICGVNHGVLFFSLMFLFYSIAAFLEELLYFLRYEIRIWAGKANYLILPGPAEIYINFLFE